MKYYKCVLCGFEFCRVGMIDSCPFCNKSDGLRQLTNKEKDSFIKKHMVNRKE